MLSYSSVVPDKRTLLREGGLLDGPFLLLINVSDLRAIIDMAKSTQSEDVSSSTSFRGFSSFYIL